MWCGAALLLATFTVFLYQVEALRCYDCDSKKDPLCLVYGTNLTDCRAAEKACLKAVIREDGERRLVRSCADGNETCTVLRAMPDILSAVITELISAVLQLPASNTSTIEQIQNKPNRTEPVEFCDTCETDGCNAGPVDTSTSVPLTSATAGNSTVATSVSAMQ